MEERWLSCWSGMGVLVAILAAIVVHLEPVCGDARRTALTAWLTTQWEKDDEDDEDVHLNVWSMAQCGMLCDLFNSSIDYCFADRVSVIDALVYDNKTDYGLLPWQVSCDFFCFFGRPSNQLNAGPVRCLWSSLLWHCL